MAEEPRFAIGVDGGASKTDAVVMSTHGRVLGSGRASGSNWENVGLDGAVNAITRAVDAALEQAGRARTRPPPARR
ncbi:MAG TPA: BadF/BadG/BcrA/BcrD ATPase family protein [Gaiellales bacterium]|nr:BadF/BadG/BcrA/BcrD ATPase family protein [Gaiellales bacterium]